MAHTVSKDLIVKLLTAARDTKSRALEDASFIDAVQKAGETLFDSIRKGGTVTTCGNGGSACDAMHFCEELVARYKRERPGIKARHLLDAGTLTCWSNDYTFETAFSRQIETLCDPPDVLVAFSTSGNSPIILRALEAARGKKVTTIGMLGKGGGKAKELCDIAIIVPSQETERIQEVHITVVHMLCEILET
jgi:D-sedoheptulose 7-phosphate isomerase